MTDLEDFDPLADDLDDGAEEAPEEVPFDYSRLRRVQLVALCRHRGEPGNGSNPDLIRRLREWDDRHPDATDEERFDKILDADQAPTTSPETPAAGAPASVPAAGPAPTEVNIPKVTTGNPGAAPAKILTPPATGMVMGPAKVFADPRVVTVGESHAGTARVFRVTHELGNRQLDDDTHMHLIAETHRQAAGAGYATRGGASTGHRVEHYYDPARNSWLATYEVHLRRA